MNGINQYLKTEVQTASPEKLLLMLYDGAIRFCNMAAEAHKNDDLNKRRELVSRVLAIASELSNNVDLENGGEVASELDALYAFIIQDLPKINFDNDGRHIDSTLKIFKDLREAYAEVFVQAQEK